MQKPKSFFRVFTESGPSIALAVAIALLVGLAGPASAQFFNFGGWSRPHPIQPRPKAIVQDAKRRLVPGRKPREQRVAR